jgi:hypothetical protein
MEILDSIRGFEQWKLSDSLRQGDYKGNFYGHLESMAAFEFVQDHTDRFKNGFSKIQYDGLWQSILENYQPLEDREPADYDWDAIDDAREYFKGKLRQHLGKEAKSETLKPMIDFTLDTLESHLQYNMMYPGSNYNPWREMEAAIRKGYIFVASDQTDLIGEFDKKIVESISEDNKGNLGIVARSKKEKSFSGFVIDNRLSAQTLVLDYLKSHAKGSRQAKNINAIHQYLVTIGKGRSEQDIRFTILLPLKRSGLVGSSNQGYYYIEDAQDFQACYDFHYRQLLGIKKTLRAYEKRANEKGIALKSEMA